MLPLVSNLLGLLSRSRENSGELQRYLQPTIGQSIHDPWPDAGRGKSADNSALGVQTRTGELEDVLHADDIVLHACHLADLDYLPAPFAHSLEVGHNVERSRGRTADLPS